MSLSNIKVNNSLITSVDIEPLSNSDNLITSDAVSKISYTVLTNYLYSSNKEFTTIKEITISNGIWLNTDGVENRGAAVGTTQYIPVFGLNKIYYTGYTSAHNIVIGCCWYDNVYNVIETSQLPNNGYFKRYSFDVPRTAYYARFCTYQSDTYDFAIEIKNGDNSSIEVIQELKIKDIENNINSISTNISNISTFINNSRGLYYNFGHSIYQSKALNINNRVVDATPNWGCSDYLDISSLILSGIQIIQSHFMFNGPEGPNYSVNFYDKDKVYLGYLHSDRTGEYTVDELNISPEDILENTKYIRYNSVGNKFSYVKNLDICSPLGDYMQSNSEIVSNLFTKVNSLKHCFTMAMFQKFAIIGDSYASGEIYVNSPHDYYNLSWGQILARKTGTTCINMSVGGLTAQSWLTSSYGLSLLNSSEAQQLYLIVLGLNDAGHTAEQPIGTIDDIHDDNPSNNPNTFFGNYGKIIEAVKQKAPNAKIILITTFRNTSSFATINNSIISISEHYSLPCIITRNSSFMSSEYYLNNLVWSHPTAYLYSCMATEYEKLISEVMYDNPSYFNDYVG